VGKYGYIWFQQETEGIGIHPRMLMEGGLGVLVQTKMGLLCACVCKSNYSLSLAKNHKFAPPSLPSMFGDLFFLLVSRKEQNKQRPWHNGSVPP